MGLGFGHREIFKDMNNWEELGSFSEAGGWGMDLMTLGDPFGGRSLLLGLVELQCHFLWNPSLYVENTGPEILEV